MTRRTLAILLLTLACAVTNVAWAAEPCVLTVPVPTDSLQTADASIPAIRALPEAPCALTVGLEAAGADPYLIAHVKGKRPRRRHISPPGCRDAPVGDRANLRIHHDQHQQTVQARRATSALIHPRPRAMLPPATAPPLPRSV
jgi:hypothetical protein